ncbi:MAG: ABC-2 type transport system permease protein [Maricaulis maris]|uniref:Putative ABC-2 type transport system permease protein n=1 Tax=Maricaulis maris (strain MCS10) TaxID=394221 RepID=Q0AKK4_MARMM|nr:MULTISPECIES: ABC transporter permease [Maricaulis]ABI67189.1 putative ABC-2 type transport system permease protein [Maricaulis maris MCS10]MAC89474.1 ABC transporter permease [Maricaulis sp.]
MIHSLEAVYRREVSAYFQTPLAYVFLAVFACSAPAFAFHVGRFFDTNRADLAPMFDYLPWLFVVLMPALAMRAWAEERDRGTLEFLMALPIPLWASTGGKFLAAWSMAALALALTFPMWLAVNYLGAPDNAAIATGYLGAWLMAGGYLAVGQALSATTSNQVVAFVLGTGAAFILTMAGHPLVLAALGENAPASVSEFVAGLSAFEHFDAFRNGVIGVPDLVYFLGLIVLALTIAGVLVAERRGGGR